MTDAVDDIAKELGVELKAPKITDDFVAAMIEREEYFHFPESTHTICVLTLYNGFRVTGESACASLENFNDEIGRRLAKADAFNHVYPFAGFWLRQKLWQDKELIDVKNQQFWISPPSAPVHPALVHIDAARDANLLDASVSSDAPEIAAALTVTVGQLTDAGLLNPGEGDKLKAGLAAGVLSEAS